MACLNGGLSFLAGSGPVHLSGSVYQGEWCNGKVTKPFNYVPDPRKESLNQLSNCMGDVVAQRLVHRTWDLKVLSLSPGWCVCIVFLGKTLTSHSASLHPGV